MHFVRRSVLRSALGDGLRLRLGPISKGQVRHLNVHEHSAFQIMRGYDIQLPKGVVAVTPQEASAAFGSEELKDKTDVVIKAQALTGEDNELHDRVVESCVVVGLVWYLVWFVVELES